MKSNKICSELRKGANFAAANLPLRPQKTTMTGCSGARNAMNLVCRKSKIREKTDLGAWGRRQAQPGDWGRLSGCFSQIREIREKTDFRGGKGDLERERGGGGQIALV